MPEADNPTTTHAPESSPREHAVEEPAIEKPVVEELATATDG